MDPIWFKSYPSAVPYTIDVEQYSSLPEALDQFCKQYDDKTAFVNFGAPLTFKQLRDYSLQLAAYFQTELGLKKGDRIAIMLPNILQYPVVLFAALRAGLIVVNINPLYTPSELLQELQDSTASAIVVLENFVKTVEQVLLNKSPITLKQVMVTKVGDLFPWYQRAIFNSISLFKNTKLHHHLFRKGLHHGKQLSFIPPKINRDDIAFLQYTGGTTGTPKGAMLSHRNVIANFLQCVTWVKNQLEVGEEVLLAALPLYHVFSLMVSGFTFLALGCKCVLITNPRNISSLIRNWRKVKPTVFIGLNTLFAHLMGNAKFNKLDFTSLKLTISGGMSTQPSLADRWQNLTNSVVVEGYGLTEASPVVTINPLNLSRFNQSIGLPVPGTDIKICNNQGQELPINTVGELYVKGPQVMKGYWNNSMQTSQVLDSDGWLKTGDLVQMNSQGFLKFVERKKDLIIVSGFNVYPSEVESVIANHPGVAEVAVIGEGDPVTGEIVKALIVKKSPELTAEDVLNYCQQELTHYKLPKKIVFCDHLLKSHLGKVLHTFENR